ncbi:aminotransferase class I/II-fold pyridoxal phosphate-dependent enzyme [Aggregatimonas sangjinii]|uniref:Aminotransferase class I/II-fold pyridoxal phosphate-dependent enzyme n=1 Tax=Aggregatimonas sangjinii TaxID=2583587 RepID=A0A5B7SU46_9FLAO|nr:aminotransferase class I/II-fold pyridoxal phosphate-dependent enzyme [Aggregatimonas sangjinii]QCX00400.1 aminotransferase class I/II-fold pyridoxal phosphate-dependent enzyme [Aggregatimonas sangjinii]
MDNPLLQKAYSPEHFRQQGHRLVDQLADHLEAQLHNENTPTLAWHIPEDERSFWNDFMEHGDENDLFAQILKRTTSVHNPKCIGHQVTPTAPITALTAMMSALLNNGMAIYEMGMAPSAMERIVTDLLCKKIGYTAEARGFLTSGGTLANLTALLSARKAKVTTDIWNQGHDQALGIMVSEQAHYCVDRAAKIMGLGEKGIRKIPVTSDFMMDTALLEREYQRATKNGIQVFAIVGSAPSTATGVYDDLDAIGTFAKKHNLWFHVDGAHGGAAIFSEKYRQTVAGIEQSDSVVIDGHKMMMLPTITTALLFKNGNYSYATFSQKADYLLVQSEDEDWYNKAKRTFECTKTMMSIHWYTMLKIYGDGIFEEYVTRLFDMGKVFGRLIEKESNFELAIPPVSNIVCFRYVDAALNPKALNALNARLRQQLLEDGEFYIVQTTLRNIQYLRCTIMNPFTEERHFKTLVEKIKRIAKTLKLTNI